MARKKVTLDRIANDATRRATFKKRRKGLMKKASELATLCDVDACVVVYGEGEAQPEVWPDRDTANKVLTRFRDMPELDQCKKMMDMRALLTQRVDKLKEQIHKARRENHEREVTMLLHDAIVGRRPGLVGLSVEEIAGLGYMVENRLACVKQAIEHRYGQGQQGQSQGQSSAAAAAAGKQPQLQQQQQGGRQQDNNNVLPTTMQMQMQMPQVSLPPLMMPSYSMGTAASGHATEQQGVHQAPLLPHLQQQQQQYQQPQPQGSWLMEVARAGGDLGALVYSGFAGGRGGFGGEAGSSSSAAGASSSGGGVAGDGGMQLPPQLGNLGPGFAWHDPGFLPPFPPM